MMDHRQYVPVLRWKRAEQGALGAVPMKERARITPIIEVTPKDYSKWAPGQTDVVAAVAEKHARTISEAWAELPAFIDFSLLPERIRGTDSDHPLAQLAQEAAERGLQLIPVARVDFRSEEVDVLSHYNRALRTGVAIRLRTDDLEREDLQQRLTELTSHLGVDRGEIDLIVDYEITNIRAPGFDEAMRRTGGPAAWRSFIALSGAFPKDLTSFSLGEHEHPRADLPWWKSQLNTGGERIATYGDYVTQYPLYAEPPRWANFSASIRYTAGDYWVIMRGEGVFNDAGPGYAQWPANALLLSDRSEFCGGDFSEGDRYIKHMGSQMAKTGNAETWLRAGLNHHLVFTARQIAKLTET